MLTRGVWRTRAVAVGIVVLVGEMLAACSGDDGPDVPDPGPAAAALAEGLRSGELDGVAFTPDTGDAAASGFAEIVAGMGETARTVEASVGEAVGATESEPAVAPAMLTWSWDVDGQAWTYDTTAALTLDGEAWQVDWEPAIVEPSLGEAVVLAKTTVSARRGDVTGAGGRALITDRPVTRFGIDRSQVPVARAARSARELARLVGVDPGPYAALVEAAGERAFVEAIVLRRDEVPVEVGSTYQSIRGALAVQEDIPLGPTADFAAPILGRVGPVTAEMVEEDPDLYRPGEVAGLSGLEARYDEQLTGAPGVVVDAVASDGKAREVFRVDAVDGDPLPLTLDLDLQLAAEQALADVGPASSLVAVRPSDGAILAAANGPGTGGVNIATYGQAAPGSTFKAVSALALLRAGLNPDTVVDCPANIVVDGRSFENYDDYPLGGLGSIPLRSALANSCNTAFIGQADAVGDDGLAAAAATLGLGIDHDLGFPAYFGQVPPPESETEAAADLIGQGTVLASPMAMATVMASIQAGQTVVPRLIETVPVEVPAEAAPLADAETDALRGMLREVVTAGSGSGLLDLPGAPVLAKTGTAEFDLDGERLLHAWMVAAQGDLAVAVYVDVGESGSRTAGPLLEAFLRAAG